MNISNERAINSAVASLEMEGFVITNEYKALCKKLLNKEITMADYIEAVKISQGINA